MVHFLKVFSPVPALSGHPSHPPAFWIPVALLIGLVLTGCNDPMAVPDTGRTTVSAPVTPASESGPHASDLARHNLHEARKNVAAGQYALAIAPLRQSAELLNRRAAEASGEVKSDLERSAQVLQRMVEREQFGPDLSPDMVDDAIAYGYFALAEFHVQQALETWLRKESDEATAFQLSTAGVLLSDANEQVVAESHPGLEGVAIGLEQIGRLLAEHSNADRQEMTSRIEHAQEDLSRLRPFFQVSATR